MCRLPPPLPWLLIFSPWRFAQATCLDQWHAEEEVHWMVMEEGSFMSDDGAQFQVGKAQVGGDGWTSVVSTATVAPAIFQRGR